MPISKPFVIATEGQTIDGRNISKEWIQQMAAHYDPKVYTAVANLEHYLSMSPDSQFSANGTVLKLSTQDAVILGDKKLQLLGVVDASEAVVAMQKVGKKLFASMEVSPNFINKGIAYLTGLAFTDKPASLGTEPMKFSAGKDNIYSFNAEIELEFEKEEAQPSAGESLFSKVKQLLGVKGKNDEARFADIGQAVEAVAVSQKELLEKFTTATTELKEANSKIAALTTAAEKDRGEFVALKQQLDATAGSTTARPDATGASDKSHAKTDC